MLAHAARRMVAAGGGGRIINVTSVHEQVPRLGAAAYCAAKAGLGMLTKVLALELAEHGITVNAVAPGEIATEMTGMAEQDAFTEVRPGNPIGPTRSRERGRLGHRLPRIAALVVRHRQHRTSSTAGSP